MNLFPGAAASITVCHIRDQVMPLSAHQLRYLRGLTHKLPCVVTVAEKGLNDNVIAELEAALKKHELIKVKLRAERPVRETRIGEIQRRCNANRVHVIGQVACFFRRNTKQPKVLFQSEP